MDRDTKRLLWSVFAGLVAVAYNADHIICAAINHLPLIPFSGLYGCKATPEITFYISGGGAWLISAWAVGLVFFSVYKAIKSTTSAKRVER